MKIRALLFVFSVATMLSAQVARLPVRSVAPHAIVSANSVPTGRARPILWGTGQALPLAGIDIHNKSANWVNVDEMQKVYGLDKVAGQGAGTTIAIVDAYDSFSAESDLNFFSYTYGLPPCTSLPAGNGCFTKVDQRGGTRLPPYDSSWSQEISLDIEWAHAMAPQAKILLVEADSDYYSDMFAAVRYAATQASVVSMSWGGGEYLTQSADWDSAFAQPHVTYLAASGDSGGWISYPSTSAKVIAVGGTTIALATAQPYPVLSPASESGWSGSGGGCSAYTPSLSFQRPLVPKICTRRAVPDLSMDADPAGSPVLVSILGRWYLIGGTSLACPMAAAVMGIANSLRASVGKLPVNNTLQHLYDNAPYPNYYRDVTTGTAGLWPFLWSASAGFDFVTGAGSPKADALVPYLVALP